MKKIITYLLLTLSLSMLGQETLVSIYGEKVSYDNKLNALVNTSTADLVATDNVVTAIGKLNMQLETSSVFKGLPIGGGTLSVTGSQAKWSTRFLVMNNGKGTYFSTNGWFDITMPTVGTAITGVGDAANVTVTASGIALTGWQSVYYILPIGGGSNSVDANFRVVNYNTTTTFHIPWYWVKVVQNNPDNSVFFWCNNAKVANNTSLVNSIVVENKNIYSTTEALTGETWTDGKAVYRITKTGTTPTGTGDATQFSITGATKIIRYNGMISESIGGQTRYMNLTGLSCGSAVHGSAFKFYNNGGTLEAHIFFNTLPDARFTGVPYQVTTYYVK
jgi:hypothetical protein